MQHSGSWFYLEQVFIKEKKEKKVINWWSCFDKSRKI
jgi:hypothetical protein